MVGAVLIIVGLVVVLPVAVLIGMGVLATLLGWFLDHDEAVTHEGSELSEIW